MTIKRVIKELEKDGALSYDIERIYLGQKNYRHRKGNDLDRMYYIVLSELITSEEYNEFIEASLEEIQEEISKVYLLNTPDLPNEIKTAVKEAITESDYPAWKLIYTWISGSTDTEYDKIITDYIDGRDEVATEVYGYILQLNTRKS